MIRHLLLITSLLLVSSLCTAHEVRPALLKISEVSDQQFLISWKVPAMGDKRLAIDPIFDESFKTSSDRVVGFTSGASIRSWYISGHELAGSHVEFSNLSSTMIDVLVQVTFLDCRYHTGLVRPSAPTFHIPTRDDHSRVFQSYLALGVEHILFGWDHLLFVLGMILLITDKRRLLWAITGFTVAHSITLALATLDIVKIPGPPVEAIIALSIVFLAVEITKFRQSGVETISIRSPWIISVSFGLIHGLGFAGALSEFGLPAHARFTSLLAFNLGVECGQILFIFTLILIGIVARKLRFPLLSHIRVATTWGIGTCGSFWLTERVTGFFLP